MSNFDSAGGGWQANLRRQTLRLFCWTAAWLLTMAIATFGPLLLWPGNRAAAATLIAINVLVGAGMIGANRWHLLSLDELQRKIYLEAMGFSLGVGLVAGLGYSMLDVADVIAFDAEISHVVILVGLTYAASVGFLNSRYR